MKCHHCWTLLEKSFWLPLEKSTIAPPGKHPSDAHVTKPYRVRCSPFYCSAVIATSQVNMQSHSTTYSAIAKLCNYFG